MSVTAILVYLCTVLAAAVVVLTRMLLGRGRGDHRVGPALLGVHTVAGAVAVLLWVTFLLLPDDVGAGDLIGVLALGCWWVVAAAGLLILMRWKPARGRRARGGHEHRVGNLWLSLAGHLGMVVAAVVFTLGYVTSAV
ncbi:hypothetical protein [Nocardioides insulae]|uniref:hypothetical protein n=1 Tax=Nocardioides insulae TaxID=394734 RepID=UPI001FDFD154|nr:hypothetical protein [Nocardioides insulae]